LLDFGAAHRARINLCCVNGAAEKKVPDPIFSTFANFTNFAAVRRFFG
jgi:hypothetical protein